MIAIIGMGYAGAATAWALARLGHGARTVLLDAEPEAGRHASGRNAGLVSLLPDADASMGEMAVRGAALLAGMPVFSRSGSVHLTSDEAVVEAALAQARRHGIPVEPARAAEVDHPWLRGARATLALRRRADGVVEPRALLDRYLAEARARGVRVVPAARVEGLAFGCGRINGVETSQGRIRADWVVNAAGAWAGELALRLGAGEIGHLGLRPWRRHLLETGPAARIDPSLPFVWDLDASLYARPSGGGVMVCPCDDEAHAPGEPSVSPDVSGMTARRLAEALPALAALPPGTARACLRTFTSDRRYAIGPEGRLPGFFWVAGLGGSGAMAGAAVGELAADLLLTGGTGGMDWTREAARWFDPARLTGNDLAAGPGPAKETV